MKQDVYICIGPIICAPAFIIEMLLEGLICRLSHAADI